MSSTKQSIIKHYIRAYNRFAVDEMLRDAHPNIVFRHLAKGKETLKTEGIEALREQAQKVIPLYRARRQKLRTIRFLGDKVEADIDYMIEMAVDLPNGPKAGQRVIAQGKTTFLFEGELIIGITDEQ
jgi:hypothetical protein